MSKLIKSTLVIFAAAMSFTVMGCWEKDSPAENAVEEAGQNMEKAVEQTTEGAEQAVESAEEATQEPAPEKN